MPIPIILPILPISRRRTTTLPIPTIIRTLQQTRIRLPHTASLARNPTALRHRTTIRTPTSLARVAALVIVFRIEAEFGLDRRAMDAVFVQALPNRLRELHIPC